MPRLVLLQSSDTAWCLRSGTKRTGPTTAVASELIVGHARVCLFAGLPQARQVASNLPDSSGWVVCFPILSSVLLAH